MYEIRVKYMYIIDTAHLVCIKKVFDAIKNAQDRKISNTNLVLSFHCVLNVICSFLGNSPASEF